MKKIIILLITLLLFSGSPVIAQEEPVVEDASSEIVYNALHDQLEVTSIILSCNDAYYGVIVKDGVNFSNKNNYFTTSSGLTVVLTNEELVSGINSDDAYTYVQELENGIFLIVKGEDEELVKSVYNGVYKTTEIAYQMFYHDIAKEWTNEVIITSDVVSFNNGEDTIYVYQNPGSISDGCYKGEMEPTVFYKELRGIDIPITYPEDVNNLSTYVPYTLKNYEHYKTENGYTPYSAYDMCSGYIILAKDDDTLKSLFRSYNERSQELGTINLKTKSVEPYSIDAKSYNLSDIKEYAKAVVNSDNRYHLAVTEDSIQEAYENGLYTKEIPDIIDASIEHHYDGGKDMIKNSYLQEVYVRPSIRTVNYANEELKMFENRNRRMRKAAEIAYTPKIYRHGASGFLDNLYAPEYSYDKQIFDNQNFFNEFNLTGDYIYVRRSKGGFYIYRALPKSQLYRVSFDGTTPGFNAEVAYEHFKADSYRENAIYTMFIDDFIAHKIQEFSPDTYYLKQDAVQEIQNYRIRFASCSVISGNDTDDYGGYMVTLIEKPITN